MKTKMIFPILMTLGLIISSCSSSKEEATTAVSAVKEEAKGKMEKVVEKVMENDYRKNLSADRIEITDKYRKMRMESMKNAGAENLPEMTKGKIASSVEALKKDHLTPELQQSMDYFCATRKDDDPLKDQGKCHDFINNSLKICQENHNDQMSDAFKACVKERLSI